MSRVGAKMGAAMRIRDREQDTCVCWHPRSKHILVMKEAGKERHLCIDCDCPNFMDIEPATEAAIREWADESHRKMHEPATPVKLNGLIARGRHPYRHDEKGGPGLEPKEIKGYKVVPYKEKKVEEGKKFDGDKLRLDLIPTVLLRGVAWILTFGAVKYGDRNWEQGILYHRVWGALLRHLLSWYEGEVNDPESGKPHLWHAACNLSFLMHFEENKDKYESFDDRPNL